MYICHGNQIFYLHPEEVTEQLFITVHPTKDCSLTPEQQAEKLCKVLNGLGRASS